MEVVIFFCFYFVWNQFYGVGFGERGYRILWWLVVGGWWLVIRYQLQIKLSCN